MTPLLLTVFAPHSGSIMTELSSSVRPVGPFTTLAGISIRAKPEERGRRSQLPGHKHFRWQKPRPTFVGCTAAYILRQVSTTSSVILFTLLDKLLRLSAQLHPLTVLHAEALPLARPCYEGPRVREALALPLHPALVALALLHAFSRERQRAALAQCGGASLQHPLHTPDVDEDVSRDDVVHRARRLLREADGSIRRQQLVVELLLASHLQHALGEVDADEPGGKGPHLCAAEAGPAAQVDDDAKVARPFGLSKLPDHAGDYGGSAIIQLSHQMLFEGRRIVVV
mmetsp:Transcript_115406/g.337467  ORF Transcript_115406/g.337467 Transcript_115406/m.337467 type:complete len:284 (+) Transcript_115406:188-1039(+)